MKYVPIYKVVGFLYGVPGRPKLSIGIAFLTSRLPIIMKICFWGASLDSYKPISEYNELPSDAVIILHDGREQWCWSNGVYFENPHRDCTNFDPKKHNLLKKCDLIGAIKELNKQDARFGWDHDGVLIKTELDFMGASTITEPHTMI